MVLNSFLAYSSPNHWDPLGVLTREHTNPNYIILTIHACHIFLNVRLNLFFYSHVYSTISPLCVSLSSHCYTLPTKTLSIMWAVFSITCVGFYPCLQLWKGPIIYTCTLSLHQLWLLFFPPFTHVFSRLLFIRGLLPQL